MLVLLLVSFFAGVLTVLAPCILPMLPVIIGGSVLSTEDAKTKKYKPVVITLSLALSVFIFTLLIKWSSLLIDIPEQLWKSISGIILLGFGLILIFPGLWEGGLIKINNSINRASNRAIYAGSKQNSFWGDVLIGAALGPVFSSCSPTYFVILATVLPRSLSEGLVLLFAYVLGLAVVLFLVGVIGQRIVAKLELVANPEGFFKKVVGVLFIMIGLSVIFGIEKDIQALVLDHLPFDLVSIEEKLFVPLFE